MTMQSEDVTEVQLLGFNGWNLKDLAGNYSSFIPNDRTESPQFFVRKVTCICSLRAAYRLLSRDIL